MALSIARPVGCKNDPVVRAVTGRDVIVIGGLVWNFRDDGSSGGIQEVCDLVELPVKFLHLITTLWRTHDHAEHGLCASPMDTWLAHRDPVGVLCAIKAEARSLREIAKRTVGVSNPKAT